MNIGDHTSIERRYVPDAGAIDVVPPDDRLLTALENADDAPLESLLRLSLDARHHAIAVHRLGEIGRGDVDILPVSSLRMLKNDEAESSRMRREAAHDEVHLFGQAETL